MIIRTIYVEFDDFINFQKIVKDSDDFEYVTLDFFRFNEKNKISSKSIQIILFYKNDESKKMMKNNNDKAIEIDKNDEKLKNSQSRDKNSKLTENFENLKINQLTE